VKLMIKMQIEFQELDADKILKMPATRFIEICKELDEISKKSQKGNKKLSGGVFGT